MMFMGAITGLAGSYYYEQAVIAGGGEPSGVLSALIALVTSFIAGAGGALIYSFLTITLRANQNVTGLTLTILVPVSVISLASTSGSRPGDMWLLRT